MTKAPMKIAMFRCCTTPVLLGQYETSTNAVLSVLGVRLVDIKPFNCCGYPLRNIDFKTYVLCSARNLALAENEGLDIITVCNCCYGSLRKADHLLKTNDELSGEINSILKKDGLKYQNSIEVKHLLSVLYHDIGLESLKERVVKSLEGLKVATHYGCHILRPSKIARFDDPIAPTIFDRLVEVTGARSLPWKNKLECCGAPALGVDDELSMDLTEKKLRAASDSGADILSVACPFCHLQFERTQSRILGRRGGREIPCILYPQLLGLSLGIEEKPLGLDKGVRDFLYEKVLDRPGRERAEN